jgi:hypothetical protein
VAKMLVGFKEQKKNILFFKISQISANFAVMQNKSFIA